MLSEGEVHATHALSNDCPLVAHLIVHFCQSVFEGVVPLLPVVEGIELGQVTTSLKTYCSLHSRPVLEMASMPCTPWASWASLAAMRLHLDSPLFWNRYLSRCYSWLVQGRGSFILVCVTCEILQNRLRYIYDWV